MGIAFPLLVIASTIFFKSLSVFSFKFFYCFNVLILKINIKKIKNIYYFDVFLSKKHFEK
jgi:hypothetical protein